MKTDADANIVYKFYIYMFLYIEMHVVVCSMRV